MNSVWKEARQRATAETLDLLKMNSLPRVMLTIGTPVAAFAATARLTGQIAIAAITALAWMALRGGVIFAVKLISAPARIAQEVRDLLTTLNAGQADVDRIRQNRLEMARLFQTVNPPPLWRVRWPTHADVFYQPNPSRDLNRLRRQRHHGFRAPHRGIVSFATRRRLTLRTNRLKRALHFKPVDVRQASHR